MAIMIISAILIFVGLAAGFVVVFVRLNSKERLAAAPQDWEGIFSPAAYQPMERLLGGADEQFVRSHSPARERKHRAVRVQIFRGYLRQMSQDFNRVCQAVKMLMVSSRVDRPDLAGLLMKQQVGFAVALMRIRLDLVLYQFGWAGVDLKQLMQPLNTVRAQLQSLAAGPQAAFAASRA
jgi:hypothetical protein